MNRYFTDGRPRKHPEGKWCKWEDVQKLEAENKKLREIINHAIGSLHALLVNLDIQNQKDIIELESIKELLQGVKDGDQKND